MHQDLIHSIQEKVKEVFAQHPADHDFDHIMRVYHMAMHLQKLEGGDPDKIACAALLHDISDHKLNGGKLNEGGKVAQALLLELGAEASFAREVGQIVDAVSYKGMHVKDEGNTLELFIVRDADRLDAMGAIGIARAFHYGGARNRPFYTHGQGPKEHHSFEEYAADKSHTINHFHEKLLLLQDRLHTESAKAIGRKRHELMDNFVNAFYEEWEFVS